MMSIKSQEANMRRLAELLGQDLGYIWGERESGPNGAKRIFLNVGRTFLRALAKDLGLRDYKVTFNAGGIAVSGECYLDGMWEDTGIHICVGQICGGRGNVLFYRSIRDMKDHKGGYNHWLTRSDLGRFSYERLIATLSALRRESGYECAA